MSQDWRLTRHAVLRAAELGFTRDEVVEAAHRPELAYSQADRAPGQFMHQRGDLAVVVDPDQRVVITVLLRRQDRWEHGRDRRMA